MKTKSSSPASCSRFASGTRSVHVAARRQSPAAAPRAGCPANATVVSRVYVSNSPWLSMCVRSPPVRICGSGTEPCRCEQINTISQRRWCARHNHYIVDWSRIRQKFVARARSAVDMHRREEQTACIAFIHDDHSRHRQEGQTSCIVEDHRAHAKRIGGDKQHFHLSPWTTQSADWCLDNQAMPS